MVEPFGCAVKGHGAAGGRDSAVGSVGDRGRQGQRFPIGGRALSGYATGHGERRVGIGRVHRLGYPRRSAGGEVLHGGSGRAAVDGGDRGVSCSHRRVGWGDERGRGLAVAGNQHGRAQNPAQCGGASVGCAVKGHGAARGRDCAVGSVGNGGRQGQRFPIGGRAHSGYATGHGDRRVGIGRVHRLRNGRRGVGIEIWYAVGVVRVGVGGSERVRAGVHRQGRKIVRSVRKSERGRALGYGQSRYFLPVVVEGHDPLLGNDA